MERKTGSAFGGQYESPILEYLDCCSEGVLCQSSPAQLEPWKDGGLI